MSYGLDSDIQFHGFNAFTKKANGGNTEISGSFSGEFRVTETAEGYYKLTAHSFLKLGNNKPTTINAMVNYRKFNEKGKHKFFEIKYDQAYSPLVEYLGSVEITCLMTLVYYQILKYI